MERERIQRIISVIARITGSLVLLFLLYFLIGHLLSDQDNLKGFGSTEEVLTFICFPVLTILGLIIAYRYEGTGALVVLLGFVGLLLLGSDVLLSPLMAIMFIPGFLYAVSWILSRKRANKEMV